MAITLRKTVGVDGVSYTAKDTDTGYVAVAPSKKRALKGLAATLSARLCSERKIRGAGEQAADPAAIAEEGVRDAASTAAQVVTEDTNAVLQSSIERLRALVQGRAEAVLLAAEAANIIAEPASAAETTPAPEVGVGESVPNALETAPAGPEDEAPQLDAVCPECRLRHPVGRCTAL